MALMENRYNSYFETTNNEWKTYTFEYVRNFVALEEVSFQVFNSSTGDLVINGISYVNYDQTDNYWY